MCKRTTEKDSDMAKCLKCSLYVCIPCRGEEEDDDEEEEEAEEAEEEEDEEEEEEDE